MLSSCWKFHVYEAGVGFCTIHSRTAAAEEAGKTASAVKIHPPISRFIFICAPHTARFNICLVGRCAKGTRWSGSDCILLRFGWYPGRGRLSSLQSLCDLFLFDRAFTDNLPIRL